MHTTGPKANQEMSPEEKWLDMATKAEHHVSKTKDTLVHTYVAAAYVEAHSSAEAGVEAVWTRSDPLPPPPTPGT